MISEKFDRLAEGLNRLLDSNETLQIENMELKEALGLKDREIASLKERLEDLDKEKGLVKERVEHLLGRLDGLIQNV